ncbi:hypothetical protein Tco_1357150 [Tanacetum coccineum]
MNLYGGSGDMVVAMVMLFRWWCRRLLWCFDEDEGVVVLWWAAVGRQPEEVEARGGEWIWGLGRSGHEDNILDFTGKLRRKTFPAAATWWPAAGRKWGGREERE